MSDKVPSTGTPNGEPRTWNLSPRGTFFAAMLGPAATTPAGRRSRAASGILLLIVSACATVPDASREIAAASATLPSGATIVGPDGVLREAQSRRLMARVAGEEDADGLLERHLAIEQAIAGTPLTAGNTTDLLRDGDGTFTAVFQAIERARHHVNLEYYTLEDVEHGGRRLSDLLVEKRRQGVMVNVIYDSYGSSNTPSEFFTRLKDAGVNLLEFRPIDPLQAAADGYSPNDRDHRKIAIVDGVVGILGGVNLATYYQSKIPGGDETETPSQETGRQPDKWRDLSIRVEGPAVAQLQGLFLGHWNSAGGPKLDTAGFFPELPRKGSEVVRIIGSSPEQDASRYYLTLISAIRHAERRIWLTTAYFVPTYEEKHELMRAARRGVDVRLMLPAVSDASQAVAVARSHYSDLLEAGVRIFELDHVILHSKTVTIDGVWSAIGSSNLDHRSVLFNDEVDAIVLGRKVAKGLEQIFEQDQRAANELNLEEWRQRPLAERVGDFLQRAWQYLL